MAWLGTWANRIKLTTDVAGGGTLYCAAKFSASKSVESGDVLKVTITITAADA